MTIKRKRIYEIIIISLVIMFTSLCAYMGITAVQKSMKLNMSFNVEPAILCQIDIKASGADDSTYKTIFNNVSSVIAENVSLSGNSLILSQTFLNAYKTSLGASVVLKITNLLDNDGIKVTTTASDGVNATSEVVMQKKGANGSAEIEVNVTNAGTLTLSYEICNEVTYNITYNNIVCVDATADNSANPTTYKNTDAAFLLIEPTKTGCEFLGWTYAGQTEPTKSVNIPQGTTGDLAFTANWGAELVSSDEYWEIMKNKLDYEIRVGEPGQNGILDHYGFYVSSITYGYWEEEKENLITNTSYSTGINMDAAGQGYIKLFIEGTDLYILSPNKMVANESIDGMFNWDIETEECHYYVMGGHMEAINVKNLAIGDNISVKSMFVGCVSSVINLNGIDVSNAKDMSYMFSGCSQLTSLDLSSFNTSNVTDMSYMFSGCSQLTSLDLSSFYTSNVTDMSYMFSSCYGLTNLDLSSFDTSKVTDMTNMFYGCYNLTTIYVSEKWSTASVTSATNMFTGCGTSTLTYV